MSSWDQFEKKKDRVHNASRAIGDLGVNFDAFLATITASMRHVAGLTVVAPANLTVLADDLDVAGKFVGVLEAHLNHWRAQLLRNTADLSLVAVDNLLDDELLKFVERQRFSSWMPDAGLRSNARVMRLLDPVPLAPTPYFTPTPPSTPDSMAVEPDVVVPDWNGRRRQG